MMSVSFNRPYFINHTLTKFKASKEEDVLLGTAKPLENNPQAGHLVPALKPEPIPLRRFFLIGAVLSAGSAAVNYGIPALWSAIKTIPLIAKVIS